MFREPSCWLCRKVWCFSEALAIEMISWFLCRSLRMQSIHSSLKSFSQKASIFLVGCSLQHVVPLCSSLTPRSCPCSDIEWEACQHTRNEDGNTILCILRMSATRTVQCISGLVFLEPRSLCGTVQGAFDISRSSKCSRQRPS